jgi:hypothetical protein
VFTANAVILLSARELGEQRWVKFLCCDHCMSFCYVHERSFVSSQQMDNLKPDKVDGYQKNSFETKLRAIAPFKSADIKQFEVSTARDHRVWLSWVAG